MDNDSLIRALKESDSGIQIRYGPDHSVIVETHIERRDGEMQTAVPQLVANALEDGDVEVSIVDV